MKPPIVSRTVLTPLARLKPYHRPNIVQSAALNARKFSATTRRPFLDECFALTHTLITGLHDTTGLSWAATIPLAVFLVRIFIVLPARVYAIRVHAKLWRLYPRFEESRTAIENKVRQEHRGKSPEEHQKIQDTEVARLWTGMVKQSRAQSWRTLIVYINVPIWFTMMETFRRMTGTEDGMLSLIAKPLTALQGKQNPGLGAMDGWMPTEPSLATQGMLWFDNLMIPDPTMILPFALSGIIFVMYSVRKGVTNLISLPHATLEQATQYQSFNQRKERALKLGALAVGPATLMFPSAMVFYWFSSTLATITVGYLSDKLPRIFIVRVSKSPEKSKPGEEKEKPKRQIEEPCPPTMKDLINQRKKRTRK